MGLMVAEIQKRRNASRRKRIVCRLSGGGMI